MINNLIPGNSASWYDSDAGTGGANPGVGGDVPNPLFVPSQEINSPFTKPNPNYLAGNAQVINPGTASFDFHYPSLEFNQTTTPAPDLVFGLTSFSGSSLSSNNDFEYSIGGNTTMVDITTYDNVDGAIGVNMNWFWDQANRSFDAGGINNNPTGAPIESANLLVFYTIIAPTGTNISASVYGASTNNGTVPTSYLKGLKIGASSQTLPTSETTQYFVGAQAGFPNPNIASGQYIRTDGGGGFLNPGKSYMTERGTTGRWEVTASFGSIEFDHFFRATSFENENPSTLYSQYLRASNNNARLFIKPFVKGLEEGAFNYQIKDITIIPQFSYPGGNGDVTLTGGDVQTGYSWTATTSNDPIIVLPSCQGTGTSSPTTNALTVANNAYLRIPNTVQVNARLMKLSGSADSTNGNIPGAPQLIYQSADVIHTLNLGTGTSVAGGGKFGGGSTSRDNYTEIVYFPDSPKLNILNPFHGDNGDGSVNWPTQVGGNGSTINEAGDIYYMEFSMSKFRKKSNWF